MRLWRITDEEYIGRIRRFYRTRRLWGGLLLLWGVAVTTVAIVWGNQLAQSTIDNIHLLADVHNRTGEQMGQLVDNHQFFMGLMLGFLFGKAAIIGGSLVVLGLGWLGRDRPRPTGVA